MLAAMTAAGETSDHKRALQLVSSGMRSAETGQGGDREAESTSKEAEAVDGNLGAWMLARARNGDPEALQTIFHRYGKPVLAFIYHMIGDRAAAEELTQETFFRAYRGLARIQDGTKFSTWLFGIARNVVREAVRDRVRGIREVSRSDLASIPVEDGKAGPEDSVISEELLCLIRRLLLDLPEDQRLVFVLKLLRKMPYEEISLITGSSIGKLKTDLHRARLQMRDHLLPYLAGSVPGM
jgi:RNA polymerase sigma-70 factor (ECF subfamily)